jgi:hypothetical protein
VLLVLQRDNNRRCLAQLRSENQGAPTKRSTQLRACKRKLPFTRHAPHDTQADRSRGQQRAALGDQRRVATADSGRDARRRIGCSRQLHRIRPPRIHTIGAQQFNVPVAVLPVRRRAHGGAGSPAASFDIAAIRTRQLNGR